MRVAAFVSIVAIALTSPACVGGSIHGLDEAAWFELLARGDPLPLREGERPDHAAIQKLGPGALLFVAMKAADEGNALLARDLLSEAVKKEQGRYRTRAVALLADTLLAAADGTALVDLCRSEVGTEMPPYQRAKMEAAGLFIAGLHAQTVAALEALRAGFPTEAGRDAIELAAMAAEAGFLAGRGRWADEFSAILAMDGSVRVYAALDRMLALVAGSGVDGAALAVAALGPRAFQLAEARSLYGKREYGPAVVAFRRFAIVDESAEAIAARLTGPQPGTPSTPPTSSPQPVTPSAPPAAYSRPLAPREAASLFLMLPRAAASDAAKAFMAASVDEGADGFRFIAQTMRDRGPDPSRDYFNLFWHARFLRAKENWQEAAQWFSAAASAASGAKSAADRDAAAWYAVEAYTKLDPARAIAPLGKALSESANPGYFSDLLEPLSREALVARNGAALAALDAAVMTRVSLRDRARLAYLCARAAMTGIIRERDIAKAFGGRFIGSDDYIESRLRVAYEQKADEWYRLAAAYRLDLPLFELPADPETESSGTVSGMMARTTADTAAGTVTGTASGKTPEGTTGRKTPDVAETVGPDDYALALARFGQGSRLRDELGPEFALLRPDTVRTVAEALSDAGRPEQAYRLIATQFWKADFRPSRADASLYWPQPFSESFTAALESSGLDEHLFYGLVRSESAFNPKAVSRSGAVGLSQLMPATADEMARRLRMANYELTNPEDNLSLGATYFARLLNGVDGRVLPAVFSYNGGPARFKRWEAEYGALPPDLLLEALSYAETRQYGRNVATAALSYAALYGESELRAYFAWILGEAPRP